mgnify:FL=1
MLVENNTEESESEKYSWMAKIQGDEFAMTIAPRNLKKLGQPFKVDS